jgi:hypothetical protein
MVRRRNRWVLLTFFTILAVLAAAFGFLGVNLEGGAGKALIVAFLITCVAVLIWGIYFGRRPPPVPPDPSSPPV